MLKASIFEILIISVLAGCIHRSTAGSPKNSGESEVQKTLLLMQANGSVANPNSSHPDLMAIILPIYSRFKQISATEQTWSAAFSSHFAVNLNAENSKICSYSKSSKDSGLHFVILLQENGELVVDITYEELQGKDVGPALMTGLRYDAEMAEIGFNRLTCFDFNTAVLMEKQTWPGIPRVLDYSKLQFEDVVSNIVAKYSDMTKKYNKKLIVDTVWDFNSPGASAREDGNNLILKIYSTHRFLSLDGIALKTCHEIGHFFGGFPFINSIHAAAEGQADYFATKDCLPLIWQEAEENSVSAEKIDLNLKLKCDDAWEKEEQKFFCYRIANASLEVAKASRNNVEIIQTKGAENPKVAQIEVGYPSPQCRFETYIAGALCSTKNSKVEIPGSQAKELNSEENRKAAEPSSYQIGIGSRPSCWYL